VTTILPFVFFSAIPIAAGVIWLVVRSVMRNEERASSQHSPANLEAADGYVDLCTGRFSR
jgi:hypothetical protein